MRRCCGGLGSTCDVGVSRELYSKAKVWYDRLRKTLNCLLKLEVRLMITSQTQSHELNGSAEIERLTTKIGQLQTECARLSQALNNVTAERDFARKALAKVLAQMEREK